MKTFFLIVALCASVAVATPNSAMDKIDANPGMAKLNKLIGSCIKNKGWSVGACQRECEITPPKEETEIDNYYDVLACIYREAGIVSKSLGGKYRIEPQKAEKLVPKEDAEKVKQVFNKCKDSALEKPISGSKIIALRLNQCFYQQNATFAAQTCQNTMAEVVVR